LNRKTNLDLIHVIHDAEVDGDGNLLTTSKYFDTLEYVDLLKKNHSGISILSSNICSIRAKFENIVAYVEHINNISGYKPSILCFQEAWISENDDLSIYNIPNYNMVSRCRSASRKGGLITYIHESMKYNEFSFDHNKTLWEALHIEIFDSKGKIFIISNIYRPPRYHIQSLSEFSEDFTKCIINECLAVTVDPGRERDAREESQSTYVFEERSVNTLVHVVLTN